jgi:putative redox protein
MNTVEPVKMSFTNEFVGEMKVESGVVRIGDQENGMRPYNLLLGALGACFYSTFLDIVKKKRLTFEGATLEISGTKRQEVPTTLDTVLIKMVIKNPSNIAQFDRSVELGTRYCSIHETISKVASIVTTVEYI